MLELHLIVGKYLGGALVKTPEELLEIAGKAAEADGVSEQSIREMKLAAEGDKRMFGAETKTVSLSRVRGLVKDIDETVSPGARMSIESELANYFMAEEA